MTRLKHRLISILSIILLTLIVCPAVTFAASKKPFVIVIDAGHGGKDVGAVDNGIKEKDINLGVALELGDMLKKKMKDVKVVYTRNDDTFKSLQERADIANKAKGNLFISIHTNSLDASNPKRTSVEGASVYVLGLHKDVSNMKVAQRENAVISLENNYTEKYEGFDPNRDESYIIFEMAQKKNLANSIKFAEFAEKELVKVAGRKDRGVHQAGFWVLWATSMPGALVELDFICNPKSAEFIGSEKGQKKLAEALFKSIEQYRKELKLAANRPQKKVVTVGEDMSVTLEASKGSTKVKSDAPLLRASAKRGRTPRRRRGSSARRVSDNRDYETDFIAINTHSEKSVTSGIVSEVIEQPLLAQVDDDEMSTKQKKNKKEKKSKKERKVNPSKGRQSEGTRMVNGHEVKLATATSDKNASPRVTARESSEKARKQSRARSKSENEMASGNTSTAQEKSDIRADKLQVKQDKQPKQEKTEKQENKSQQSKKDIERQTANSKVKGAFSGNREIRNNNTETRETATTKSNKVNSGEENKLNDPDNRLHSRSRSRHGSRN